MAAQQPRPARPRRLLADGLAHALLYMRMLGKPEVVVRHQVDALRQAHLTKKTGAPQLRKGRRKAGLKLFARVHA